MAVDTNALTDKVKNTDVGHSKGPAGTIADLLKKMGPEIKRALPKHMDADRLARVALTTIRTNPRLLECNPQSLLAAIMQSAQLGLEPGLLGHCYLVPFKDRKNNTTNVQFIIGYKGLIDLARRSGSIESIAAHIVHDGDEFEFQYGLDEKLVHKPALDKPKGKSKAKLVYAYAKFQGGGHQIEVMTIPEIEAVRQRSRSKDDGPWVSDWEEMAKKTAIRRLWKYLPISIEVAQKVLQDGAVKQAITEDMADAPDIGDAIEGEWSVKEDEEADVDDKAKELFPSDETQ